MPQSRITDSRYYATPRTLTAAAAGAYAVLSPSASPTSGDRIQPGKLIGTSTGQIVVMPGQAKGLYFVQVRRANGSLAWVLNSYVVLPNLKPQVAPTAQLVRSTPQPASKAVQPDARPAAQLGPQMQAQPGGKAGGKPGARAGAKPGARPVTGQQRSQAPAVKTGDGASALQAIIANDQRTHEWLVQALYWQAKATQLSGPTADLLGKKLTALIASYNARQAKIKSSRYVKVSTGVSNTVQGWITRLKGLVGMNGIGILPALPAVPIVIAFVVGAAMMGGVWLLLHDDVPQSANDLHEAAKLTETYRGMSQQEKELFDKTTDDAAKAGADSVDNSFFGKLKNNALLIGGCLFLYAQATKRKK